MRFTGQVAVVTGASRGIGRAISDRLESEGARVARVSRSEGYAVDVSDPAAVQQAAARILADFGRVDILVNNAGITRDGLTLRMSLDDWDAVMDTNLRSAFVFSQALMRSMVKQRSGRIINIGSISGLTGNAGQANYSASKAGLIGLTKTMARELASRGITVNAVAPGLIETDMTSVLSEEIRQSILQKVPLGKLGEPDDIAAAVAFLASAEAKYITGQVLVVDGGMVM